MPAGGLVVAGAAGLGSAILGSQAAQSQTDAANAARKQALQQWLNVNVPDPAQQQVELQKYAVTGSLSPQLEQAFQQSQTGLKNLSVDPTSRAAEVQALEKMQNIASNGGMDAQSRQQEAQALNSSNANERGQRGAIEQNFAARGIGGTGAQLAAELEASQGDANSASAAGMSSAASGESRALQALASSGNMASTLNNQDYNQAAKAAEAQDAINRFNTENSQKVANSNVTGANNAQAANLANNQSVSNSNAGIQNQQTLHNAGLIQQQFANEATKAGGSANAETGVATQSNQNAANAAGQWAGIGKAITSGVGAIANYNQKQNNNSADETDSEEE